MVNGVELLFPLTDLMFWWGRQNETRGKAAFKLILENKTE